MLQWLTLWQCSLLCLCHAKSLFGAKANSQERCFVFFNYWLAAARNLSVSLSNLFFFSKKLCVCMCVLGGGDQASLFDKSSKICLTPLSLAHKHSPSYSFSLQLMWSDTVMISECSHSSGDLYKFTQSDRTQTHRAFRFFCPSGLTPVLLQYL